ncbi:MAG: DEAD/DEAH box helicase [Gemmatirosa sp.]
MSETPDTSDRTPEPVTLESLQAAEIAADTPADIDAATDAGSSAASAAPDTDDGGFAALGLHPSILDALTALGYEEPTPIQRATIPLLLSGRDVLGQAATGTGKTAAFALPLLHRLMTQADRGDRDRRRAPGALVLVPTRELAMQVAEAIHKYGKGFGARVLAVYGGTPMEQQLRALSRGVDVVVGTPGRLLDHINRKSLDLSRVSSAVLDEADEMLDMGFADELEAILEKLPPAGEGRQTALFSATMPPRIAAIGERHLNKPERVAIARERLAAGVAPRVRQIAYVVNRQHKLAALGRVLDMESPTSAIVFCRTRGEVDELTESLAGRGYRAEALHGGLSQDQRDHVMRRFREGNTELLIATDVAARGLDVEHLSHVVNYDLPNSPDVYTHRIGRTGRAGREGVAITLAQPREHRLLRNIEELTGQPIRVEAVPSIVDLRTRRLEVLRASLREAIVADGFDPYRAVVESLAEEFDIMDVAMAAVQLAHAAEGGAAEGKDAEEIPSLSFPAGRGAPRDSRGRDSRGGPRQDRFGGRDRGGERFDRGDRPPRGDRPDRGPRPSSGGSEYGERPRRAAGRDEAPRSAARDPRDRDPRTARTGMDRPSGEGYAPREERGYQRERGPQRGFDDSRGPRAESRGAPRGAPRGGGGDVARIFVGLGKQAGVRPGDLVGAIANEAGVDARDIGAIDIADRFALVEVPGAAAERVVRALRDTTIRGRKVDARRDRDEP